MQVSKMFAVVFIIVWTGLIALSTAHLIKDEVINIKMDKHTISVKEGNGRQYDALIDVTDRFGKEHISMVLKNPESFAKFKVINNRIYYVNNDTILEYMIKHEILDNAEYYINSVKADYERLKTICGGK